METAESEWGRERERGEEGLNVTMKSRIANRKAFHTVENNVPIFPPVYSNNSVKGKTGLQTQWSIVLSAIIKSEIQTEILQYGSVCKVPL